MYFKVNLRTLEVSQMQPRSKKPEDWVGVTSNGQHDQLPGYALAEWSGKSLLLFHPDTTTDTGHFDVRYYPERGEGALGIKLIPYSGEEFTVFYQGSQFTRCWPSGILSLVNVVAAIEDFLNSETGHWPTKMKEWLEFGFWIAHPSSRKDAV